MEAGGFVLAGGRSTRMGRDKALLPWGDRTLIEHVAAQVAEAAGNVTIIADPARYSRFRIATVADRRLGCGPLGGLLTALEQSEHPWNLIVACDMPHIDSNFLSALLDTAQVAPGFECVVPLGPSGPEPLCAVYHRDALIKIRTALDRNILKMQTLIASLAARFIGVQDTQIFRNVNTPEDWAAHE